MNPILQSSTAQYGVPDLQLGAQLTTSPNPAYVHAYWSSPTHNFVPFLIGVKNKYVLQGRVQVRPEHSSHALRAIRHSARQFS